MSNHYTTYILHFPKPYWNNAQHYVGYTNDLDRRINQHRAGTGSLLVRYAIKLGMDFETVRTWDFDDRKQARIKELKIKNSSPKKYCPECKT